MSIVMIGGAVATVLVTVVATFKKELADLAGALVRSSIQKVKASFTKKDKGELVHLRSEVERLKKEKADEN